MQRHTLIHKKPTYRNIAHVEKMGSATWKQTLKNSPSAKQNLAQTQTCGRLKKSTYRKERKVASFIGGDREVTGKATALR
jgi:hypothetical protein